MKFPSPVPVKWIAELIGAELMGNTEGMATGINEIHRVEPGDLVFVDHPKYYDHCIRSNASFIIIDKPAEFPDGKALLVTEKPFEAYQKIVLHFQPFRAQEAMRGENLRIGEDTYIGPGTYLGYNVTIGSGCRIGPNVTILDHTEIGNRVVIQAGTVIGSDAFYYNSKKDREVWYRRMESCGKVVLEDEVEIGAGCTIDRGVTHDTRVGRGTKIDNMVHIGHDSLVGRNCLIAAQVGIAGVVEIGNGVILWGQAGVSKTLSIGDNAVVLAQSGVPSSLAGGKTYFGSPAEDASIKRRELVWIKRIPEIWEKLKHLRP